MSLEFSELNYSLSLYEVSFNDICYDISDIIPGNNQVGSIGYDIRNKLLSPKDLEKLFISKKISFKSIFKSYHDEFKNLTYHILDINIPNLESFKRIEFMKLILLYSFVNKFKIKDDANIFPIDLFLDYINIFLQLKTIDRDDLINNEIKNLSNSARNVLETA